MNHVGIDLGGKESQVCMRRSDGTILEEKKVSTRSLPSLFKGWERSRIILETCSEAFCIADAATAQGHEVRVVAATLVRSLGVGARRIKTDRRDAQVLSEVSTRIDLPSVHVPSTMSREMKALSSSREVLVRTRTALINNVRGWLRTQLWRIRRGATATFVARVRAHASTTGSPLPAHIESQLEVIEAVHKQVKVADRRVLELAKTHPVCLRLMTVPGVGAVTAVRFVAALDEHQRFPRAHALQSYLGLTPGERSSSERQHRTGITKAGPTELRRLLVQAAWSALRTRPLEPMVIWANRVMARRGKFVGVVALARKIAGILFAIWRDGTTYRSQQEAPSSTPA